MIFVGLVVIQTLGCSKPVYNTVLTKIQSNESIVTV